MTGMGKIAFASLAGITAVETSITFILFIEEEAIQTVLASIHMALKYGKKAQAMRLISALETRYLPALEDDLASLWGGGSGFDIPGVGHYNLVYSHSAFDTFAKAVRDEVNALKLILDMPGANIDYLKSPPAETKK